jgi:hypothetical protein
MQSGQAKDNPFSIRQYQCNAQHFFFRVMPYKIGRSAGQIIHGRPIVKSGCQPHLHLGGSWTPEHLEFMKH